MKRKIVVLNRKRKIVVALGLVLLSALLIIAALPLWFPLVAQRIAGRYGVTFSDYERQGYSRVTFSDVKYSRGNAAFEAEQLEILQPTIWLWKYYVTQTRDEEFAKVRGWELTVEEKKTPGPGRKKSPAAVMRSVDRAVRDIRAAVPHAAFVDGIVRLDGEVFEVPTAKWDNGKLSASVTSRRHPSSATIRADLTRAEKVVILSNQGMALEARVQAGNTSVNLDGVLSWFTNRVALTAEFTDSWIPETASAQGRDFRVPAETLRLEGYEDLVGNFSAKWQTNGYSVDVTASAQPARGSPLSPVNVVLRAGGTTNRVHFDTATLSTPWLRANLSRGVEFDYSGKLLSPAAALSIEADLGRQEFIDATGRFSGEAFLSRSQKKYPFVDFTVKSTGFQGYGLDLRDLKLKGTLDWPIFEIGSAQLLLADGAAGDAQARINVITRQFETGKMRLEVPGPLGRDYLPPGITYSNIMAELEFSGPIRRPLHSGNFELAGLTFPDLSPLTATGSWRGKFTEIDAFAAEARAQTSGITIGGSAVLLTNGLTLSLSNLVVTTPGVPALLLQEPVTATYRDKLIQVSPLTLKQGNRDFSLQGKLEWPLSGSVGISAHNLNVTNFQDFFPDPLSHINVRALQFTGSWTNGPLHFVVRANGEFKPVTTNALSMAITASSDGSGIAIENLAVLSDAGPVLNGRGFFPAQIDPTNKTNQLQLLPRELIDLRVDTAPNRAFWERVERWTNLRLHEPSVHAVISGTLEKPKGKIVARVAELSWTGPKAKVPRLTEVRADIHVTEQLAQLSRLEMLLENQPIHAEAKLPLDDLSRSWRKVFDWRKASGKVYAREIELAPFRKYIPDILAPQGRLDVDIAFAPGMKLDGWLIVDDAATRPLPGSGPLHDLQARLRFTNHIVELQDVRGLLGGQPIGIFGRVDFGKSRNNLPLMDLSLLGESVPLARRPEAIIRGDLKLKLSNLTNDIPVISGEVRLRDSYYLGDIKQLVPGRVASPKRRPPYFSVSTDPFDEWLADVSVVGENFLNVRSPLFRGKISANWRITGTLGEPVALGDAEIESGLIQFPFANFRVTRGFMTLTSEDPYRPEVFVTATSRAFGYDLQLMLSGPANAPIVEFSSTPPLTSEQVIAMVTTGEVPNRTFGVSEQQRAQRLALFLGRSLLSKFSDPAGGERLTISTGEEISEEGRETYGLEYKITDDWSIVAEYDRFGAVNVGVKWRIYSR